MRSTGGAGEQFLPPAAILADSEAHLLLDGAQIKADEVGETALEGKIRHAAGELSAQAGSSPSASPRTARRMSAERARRSGKPSASASIDARISRTAGSKRCR